LYQTKEVPSLIKKK